MALHAVLDRSPAVSPVEGLKDKFQDMLYAIDARPRLVVDREQRVLWRSDRAAKLLRPPVPLVLQDDRLIAAGANAAAELADFIEGATGDCSSLLLRDGGRHWAMVLAWVLDGNPDVVCLLVNLSVPHRQVDESGLARALRLTTTEVRVLDLFARLYSPREIGERLGISLSTVRSHLKQIYSKAGVDSAVQLTQLVRGFCAC